MTCDGYMYCIHAIYMYMYNSGSTGLRVHRSQYINMSLIDILSRTACCPTDSVSSKMVPSRQLGRFSLVWRHGFTSGRRIQVVDNWRTDDVVHKLEPWRAQRLRGWSRLYSSVRSQRVLGWLWLLLRITFHLWDWRYVNCSDQKS